MYDATDPVNRVHCRLVWAHPSQAFTPASTNSSNGSGSGGWRWVDPGGLTGKDLIPLNSSVPAGDNAFDSHLCYAAPPVHTPDGERLYYMVRCLNRRDSCCVFAAASPLLPRTAGTLA